MADLGALTLQTVGTNALLLAALPFNLVLTTAALTRRSLSERTGREVDMASRGSARTSAQKTVLLTGGKMTKALQLARSFHAAGHRVVLVESARYRLTGHRFSRAVDKFYTVPDSGSPEYVDALLDLITREEIDVIVPVCSPASSRNDALAKPILEQHCEVVHVGPELLEQLDNKFLFAQTAQSLGLTVPDTHLITDPAQVADFDFESPKSAGRTYVLKSIAYDPIRRLDLTPLPRPDADATEAFARSLPISPENPWILQEFIRGQEYCTHGTVRNGILQLHCCCESSAFQINYKMVDKPEIEKWVRRFVEGLNITGQVSLDFIQDADGELFAIECNPRTHSAITMFYDNPAVAAAYLEDDVPTVLPTAASKPTYWLYHEIWRILSAPRRARERIAVLREGTDAIFDWSDPLPFLAVHHLHVPSLMVENLRGARSWIRIDFNIGKLVEPGGD